MTPGQREVVAELDAQQEATRRRDVWKTTGLPRRHRAELDGGLIRYTPGQLAAMARLRTVIEAGGIAALIGPVGPGKTLIAGAALMHWSLTHGWTAKYWRLLDLIDHLRSKAYGGEESVGRLLSSLTRQRLLVLDEIDKVRRTEDEELWLERLIDHRYGEKAPTVLVANLSLDGLWGTKDKPGALSAPIKDRVRAGGAVIELVEDSQRGRKERAL